MNTFRKPTDEEKLKEANEYFDLPNKKVKHHTWWEKLKIALYEDKANADFEVIEPKQLSESKNQLPQ